MATTAPILVKPAAGTLVRVLRVVDALALYLGSCALFIAVREDSLVWGVVLTVVVVATALWLHSTVRRELLVPGASRGLRVALTWVLIVTGFLLLVAWSRAKESDGWGFFGVATLLMGIGLLIGRARRSEEVARRVGIRILVFCGVAIVAGLIGIHPNSPMWAKMLLGAGIVLAPAGLSLVSADANRRLEVGDGDTVSRGLLRAGVIALVVTFGLLLVIGIALTYAGLALLVLIVIVLATTSRANGDIAMGVAGVALFATFANQTVAPSDALRVEAGDRVVVAFGDSFMSGEGAPRYFDGTNTKGENSCRRAPTAYAPLLVEKDGVAEGLVFLACSGADAVHVYEVPQHPGEPIGAEPSIVDGREVRGLDQLSQLARLREAVDIEVDFALVSIGGNNSGFGTVARTCVMPGNCAELGGAWLEHLPEVEDAVDRAFDEIADALPDTRVLVVPYPIPVAEKHCEDATLRDEEFAFIHDFATQLDEAIRRAAGRANFEYVHTMRDSLNGIRLCDGGAGEVGVNFLARHGVQGFVEDAVNPANWVHNSMHPNDAGHERMRQTVSAWLEAEPGDGPAAPPLDETLAGYGNTTCRDLTFEQLEECANDWSLGETSSYGLRRLPVALLAALGAWLASLWAVYRWRTRWSAPVMKWLNRSVVEPLRRVGQGLGSRLAGAFWWLWRKFVT